MKKNLVIFLTSGFSKASLNLYSPQVLLTWQPNPARQFLEISNPAGQFLAVSNLAGYFIDVFQENIFFCSLENISKSKKFFGPKKNIFLNQNHLKRKKIDFRSGSKWKCSQRNCWRRNCQQQDYHAVKLSAVKQSAAKLSHGETVARWNCQGEISGHHT